MFISDKYHDIKHFKSFQLLREHGLGILKETIESFFNCKASFFFEPMRQAKRNFDINLHDNPNRGCYPIDEDTFFIYARILDSKTLVSGLGIVLKGKCISNHRSLLNKFEGALTNKLSISFLTWFKNCSLELSDDLLTHTMANFCVRGYVDYRQFEHLILFFHKLKCTTFEGKPFSTGLIITKSHFSYKKIEGNERFGLIFPLVNRINIKSSLSVDRRFWYLADGKHTFFVANKSLEIQHLFVLGPEYADLDYLDSNSLALTLRGGDTLLRVDNEKQFSVIIPEGIEFLYLENRWKVRNYNLIKEVLRKAISDENVINRILFYVLYCSKNSVSSVLWIPAEINKILDYIKPETLNKLIYKSVNICDSRFINQIMRYLSSDGATVIDAEGNLLYFGCIVNLSKLEISGIKGTGESAAQVLCGNGLSFKISQDGNIKLFFDNKSEPVLI
jgi:hypothetical protein